MTFCTTATPPRCTKTAPTSGGQQLLGHARLDTTSIDTQVAITQLKEVYERIHPAAVIEIENDPPEC